MGDNGRIFKEAYRTCKREYDTLIKKYDSVRRSGSWQAALKWMLPVLLGAAILYAAVCFLLPGVRPAATALFVIFEIGFAIGCAGYILSLIFGGSGADAKLRVSRLSSILEQLDEAWVDNDVNEATMRMINAERELRKTQRYSVSGIRDRVMSGVGREDAEGSGDRNE